jgi:KDO2-lipid IV(A) lauroyltransferase
MIRIKKQRISMSKRTDFQNRIEYCVLKIFVFIIYLIRRPLASCLAHIVALILFYFIPFRKKEVIEGLKLAFPQKNLSEIQQISKRVYENFAQIFVDIFFISKMSDEKIESLVVYDEEIIKKALAKGKGLVLMSAHYGNWELTALALAKKYPVALIIATQSNSYVDRMINEFRIKEGFNIIGFQRDDKISFRGILKALRKNQILAILGDQDDGHQGIFLPFFGRIASTPKGPAFFALQSGSPIITAFGVRQKDGSMKMIVEELPISNIGNAEEDIKTINKIYYKRLEVAIREYPEQWFWFHRRWKTKPPSNRNL